MVEAKWNVHLIEQAGSGYIFANDITRLTVSSEIYFGRYTVWTLPTNTLEAPN